MEKKEIRKMLERLISSYEPEIIEFTKELISIDTTNPPGRNYAKICGVLDEKCRKLGMKTRVIDVPKSEIAKKGLDPSFPRLSVLADYDFGCKKTVHFNAHIDVVPAKDGWKTDPFVPKVTKTKIFGRGTFDDKANISSMIYSFKALKESGLKPSCNVQFSFTCDEETGGELGLGYINKMNLVKPDFAIGEGQYKTKYSHGNKGVLWVKVEVYGKASHAAYPYKGKNAFEDLIKLSNHLLSLKNKTVKIRSNYEFSRDAGKYASFVLGGLVEGGNKVNTVPGFSSFSIDRRILPEEKINDVYSELKKDILDYAKDNSIKVKIKVLQKSRPVVVDTNSMFAKCVADSVKSVYGSAKPIILSGATDMRYFVEKGIPSLGYGIYGKKEHSANECVYIDSILKTARVFALIAVDLR